MVQTKETQPEWKKKGVVYQVPCAKCDSVYIGKTGRTLEKRLSEHKGAVTRHDVKNGIAVLRMDQAAQGGLAGSSSKACGDQPHKEKKIEALNIHLQ